MTSMPSRRLLEIARHPRRSWPEIRLALRARRPSPPPAPDGSAPTIRALALAVNASCAQACPVCDIGPGRDTFLTRRLKGETLTTEDCRKLAGDLRRWRPQVSFHDAEPLMHPEWRAMVETFAGRGFFVSMTTAGTGLKEAARDLAKSGLHHLEVSADGGSEEAYRAARADGSLAGLEEGIRSLIAERKGPYPRISLNAVISGFNAGRLGEMGEFAVRLGVPVLTFTQAFGVSGSLATRHNAALPRWPLTESRSPGPSFDAAAAAEEISSIRSRHPGLVVACSPDLAPAEARRFRDTEEPLAGYARCRLAWSAMQVLPNGDATSSLACFAPAYGNIRSEPPTRLWNSESAKAFRRALLGPAPPGCLRCGGLYCG